MHNDFRSSALDRYLNDISRYPLMSPEEEIRLGKLVQSAKALKAETRELTPDEQRIVRRGDKAIRRFVEANLRLVVYIAKRYASRQPQMMDMLDLVQEGAIGLVRAAEMFDPERGYKFSTYSFWWCRQAMSRALQNQERMIRRPSSVAELAGKLHKTAQKETQRLGRTPTTAELAAVLKVKQEEILLLMERGLNVSSLDAMVAGMEDKSLLETIADPNSLNTDEQDMEMDLQTRMPLVLNSIKQLPEKERLFIQKRFGINGYVPHTYQEIAAATQVSRERVRQVIDTGLRKIRLQMARNGQALNGSRTAAAPDAATTAPGGQTAPPLGRELHPAWADLQTAA
jgi:RNA polymerase sigma factor (sigma-70 family)